MTINEWLVKRLFVSKGDAMSMIAGKKVVINGTHAFQKQKVNDRDTVAVGDLIIQQPHEFHYYLFNKPRGVECTLNPAVKKGLHSVLPFDFHIFPVGRLDKESEGLLLLTNDGKVYKNIAGSEQVQEKEYLVTVNKKISDEMIDEMTHGVVIMGQRTRPAKVVKIDDHSFNIILTQGLNRQIRRMCYKLGYEVVMLKRIRIKSILLGDLKPGEFKRLQYKDIEL